MRSESILPRRRASAMVIVMGVLSLLAVIISTFVTVNRSNYQASAARSYVVRTDLLADGVLNQVRTTMARDIEIGQEPCDHPRFDPWLAAMLTDNSGLLNPANGQGAIYRYITRMDLADNAWAGGSGALAGGRPPENINMAAQSVVNGVTTWIHAPTKGTFTDANRDGIPDYMTAAPANWYYVDADGDGKADAVLGPVGNGVAFPDGSCAYVAVRVVDNAHLNPMQHSKWPPFFSYSVQTWPNHLWDSTDGRVDWNWVPDAQDSTQSTFVHRPRLPHVSFQNLRNIAMLTWGRTTSAGFDDNPDPNEVAATTSPFDTSFAMGNGWSWNNRPDRLHLTDELYYPYEPGVNPAPADAGRPRFPLPGTGVWGMTPTSMYADKVSMTVVPFGVEDDLALRSWNTDPRAGKYAQVYGLPFGTHNLGGIGYEQNYARMVSSVTRERCKKWLTDAGGSRVYTTPFDLRRLLDGLDYASAKGLHLERKLSALAAWMKANRVLEANGISPTGSVGGNFPGVGGDERRAQFLANLAEYMRPAPADNNYVPTAYNFTGLNSPVYGVCRQPYITEVIRDGGVQPTQPTIQLPGAPNFTPGKGGLLPPGLGGIPPGQLRNFGDVRLGVEIYNPYDRPIRLGRYSLVFRAHPGGGVTRVSDVSLQDVSLSELVEIAPYGYAWISTDNTERIPGTGNNTSARLVIPTDTANLIKRMGPRLSIELRCTATDNASLLMDLMDSRERTGTAEPVTANPPLNNGFSAISGGGTAKGLDFSDWDGHDAVRNLANNGWVNNLVGNGVAWVSFRSGVYRPQSRATNPAAVTGSGACYWLPATAVTTNLWMGYATVPHSETRLDQLAPFNAGTTNWHQNPLAKITPPAQSANGYFDFGTDVKLPNRGVDDRGGAMFFNLGELAHVLTVGNSTRYCLSQYVAGASEYARITPPNAAATGPSYMRPVAGEQGYPCGLPEAYGGYGVNNPWIWINFERKVKFDIYEGAILDTSSGIPSTAGAANVRMLDLVSLYLGNGGTGNSYDDFAPYNGTDAAVPPGVGAGGGNTEDTSLDIDPNHGVSHRRPRYREGRINLNTAPPAVLRCLPWARTARDELDGSDPWYADGAVRGNNVVFSECLAGSIPGQAGYLNTTLANGRDPYFANVSDVYLYAQAANPNLHGRFFNRAGAGWDMPIMTATGSWCYASGGAFGAAESGPYKMNEYKRCPHQCGYQYPVNRNPTYPSTGGVLEYPERGCAADMSVRDSYWAATSNVVSTRSDIFTVYILIKLIRPTPGVVQATTGQQFEDLGETRLTAVLDRTTCRLLPTTGTLDPNGPLPRVLGRVLVEGQ